MTREQKLATVLHALRCRWNHTDGCGWYYDKGGWTDSSRIKYLKCAESEVYRHTDVQLDFYLSLVEHIQDLERRAYELRKSFDSALVIK